MRRLAPIFAVVFLVGCAAGPVEPLQSAGSQTCYLSSGTADCASRPDIAAMTLAQIPATYQNEPWVKNHPGEPPLIGLALMGGGSQAGAFALGVIKRLVDSGQIGNVDIVSSVSGGGYAALYLYSRAAFLDRAMPLGATEDEHKAALKALFAHRHEYCVGDRKVFQYKVRTLDFLDSRANDNLDGCGGYFVNANGKSKDGLESACQHARDAAGQFGAASMLFVQCYQDLLAGHFSKSTRTNNPPDWGKISADFVGTLLAAPFQFATNVAFDTRAPLSPSRFTYRTGVYRAFGYVPECWLAESVRQPDDAALARLALSRDCETAFRHQSHQEIYLESNDLKFEVLKRTASGKTGLGKMPMWILNATTTTRPVWDLRTVDVSQMDVFRFEFTPYGFGGRRHGFVGKSPSTIDVDAMTALMASAGFADPAQRIFSPVRNGGFAVVGNLLGIDWSTSIPNYRQPPLVRTAIAAIPAPLHVATRFDEADLRSKIHLGDGGISRDSFGAVALIERGVRHIFISDHVNDESTDRSAPSRTVRMDALCNLSKMLALHGLKMRFDGHPEVAPSPSGTKDAHFWIDRDSCDPERGLQLAKSDKAPKAPLDYRHWMRPLWRGQIVCVEMAKCSQSVANGIYLYLIKTAIDQREFRRATNCQPATPHDLDTRCDFLNSHIVSARQRGKKWVRPSVPPYLLGWWIDGATAPTGKGALHDSLFPQDSMFSMTADNSQSLFTAYFELGNYLAYDAALKICTIAAKESCTR